MEISVTNVEFFPIPPREGLIGFASIIIDDAVRLDGLGVHTRPNGTGIRIVYPTKQLPHGAMVSLIRPVRAEISVLLDEAVWRKIDALYKSQTISKEAL